MRRRAKSLRTTIVIPNGCRERYLKLDHPATRRLVEAGVRLAGVSRLSSGYEMQYSQSTHVVVIGTVDGMGWLTGAHGTWDLTDGSVMIAPPGVPLSFGAHESWEIVWFHLLSPSRLGNLPSTDCTLVASPLAERLRATMEGLMAETGASTSPRVISESSWQGSSEPDAAGTLGDLYNHRAGILQSELLEHYLERVLQLENSSAEAWRRRLDALWRSVQVRPNQRWQIIDLCERVQVSPSTLQRLVQRYHGTTPRQMVIRIRMDLARRLLTTTDYPIHFVAQRLGYADQFAFSTAFKNATGLSPRQFRRANGTTAAPPQTCEPPNASSSGASIHAIQCGPPYSGTEDP